jgi:hypothetical protein
MHNYKQLFFLMMLIGFFQNGLAQVGINTTAPLSTLDINGNLSVKELGVFNSLVAGSGPFIGGAPLVARPISDGVYISLTPVSISGANGPEFLLPNAASVPGRIYILRNITPYASFSGQNALIYSSGGTMFPKNSNVSVSPVTMEHTGFRKTLIFVSDGANWTFFE